MTHPKCSMITKGEKTLASSFPPNIPAISLLCSVPRLASNVTSSHPMIIFGNPYLHLPLQIGCPRGTVSQLENLHPIKNLDHSAKVQDPHEAPRLSPGPPNYLTVLGMWIHPRIVVYKPYVQDRGSSLGVRRMRCAENCGKRVIKHGLRHGHHRGAITW